MKITASYANPNGMVIEIIMDVPDGNWQENMGQFSANFQRFIKDTEQYLQDGKKLGNVVVQTA